MRSRFFLIALAMFIASPLVFSAPVSNLDIDLLNAPALVNKDLNFQGTWGGGDANVLYWQFDSDGNVVINGIGSTTIYIQDDFDGTGHGGWTVSSGTWSESGGSLNQTGVGTGEIYFDTGQSNDWSATGLDVAFTVDATNVAFSVGDAATIAGSDGYRMTTASSEYKLQTITSGSTGDILVIGNSVSAGTIIRWKFDTNGLISGFRNGVLEGSVMDTNFNAFRYGIIDATQNAGLRDVNVTSLTAQDNPIPSGASQTHTFTSTGQKRIQLTAQNPDGNASTFLDVNVLGALTFTVFDENTGLPVPNTNVDFNGGSYITDASGFLTIPLGAISSGEKTIGLSATGYNSRSFVYDVNEFSALDLNLLLLPTPLGSSIGFTLYQPNQSTLITNSIVEFRNTSLIANGIATRSSTSSTGTISAFLQQQNVANYVMRINDSVSSVVRDYNGTLVTVEIPRDITDLSILVSPYDLEVGGLATQSYSDLNNVQVFGIFSDTDDYYSFTVDGNTDYHGTSKLIKTLGGQATETFQPYLVPVTGNLESIIYAINNSEQRTTVPGVRIESSTDVDGSSVLVESRVTDITGTIAFHFAVGKEYALTFYDSSGELLFSGTLTPKSSDGELFAFLQEGFINNNPTTSALVQVSYTPSSGNLKPDADGNVSVSQTILPFNTIVGDVNVIVTHGLDTNVVYSQVFSLDTNNSSTINYEIDVNGMSQNQLLKINVNVYDINGTIVFSGESSGYTLYTFDITDSADLLTSGLGSVASALFAIIISIIPVGFVSSQTIGEDTNFAGILAILTTGIFVVLGFIAFNVWAFASLLSVGFMLWGVRQ